MTAGCRQRIEHLDSHVSMAKGRARTTPEFGGASRLARGTSKPMTVCPHCGAKVRRDRLSRHVNKVHPTASFNTARNALLSRRSRTPADTVGRRYSGAHCQRCGAYLTTVCYSQHKTGGRVPRSNKICEKCFYWLPPAEQTRYHRYNYAKWGVLIVNSGQTRKR